MRSVSGYRIAGLFNGSVAEAVGCRLAFGGSEHDKPDETDKRNEVDEPPAAAFADVVHAAPAHCQRGHDEQYA